MISPTWRQRLYTVFFYGGLFLFWVMVNQMARPLADDYFYAQRAHEVGLFTFLQDFYYTWSGRVVANGFAYLLTGPLFPFWRVLNAGMIMLCAFAVTRLARGDVQKKDYLLSTGLLSIIPVSVLSLSIFWATGSIYYLWPMTMGLLLMVPFSDHFFQRHKPIRWFPLLVLAALYAGAGNEQVALCALGFMGCFFLHAILAKRPIPPKLLILFFLTAGAFALMMLAPGNGVRFQSEIQTHFPDFLSLPIRRRLSLGVRWTYDRLFTSLRPLVLLSYLLALLKMHKPASLTALQRSVTLKRHCLYILLVIAVSPMILGDTSLNVFFTFFQSFAGSTPNKLMLAVPHVFWTLFSLAWVYLLFRARPLSALCLMAGLGSLVVMWFSPTIHASLYRTSLIAGALLAMGIWWIMPEGRIRSLLQVGVPVMGLVNIGYLLITLFFQS